MEHDERKVLVCGPNGESQRLSQNKTCSYDRSAHEIERARLLQVENGEAYAACLFRAAITNVLPGVRLITRGYQTTDNKPGRLPVYLVTEPHGNSLGVKRYTLPKQVCSVGAAFVRNTHDVTNISGE